MDPGYEAIEAWEESMNEDFVNKDFYDYLYKTFIWDYHLNLINEGLVPNVDFNCVVFVFSKSEINFKFDLYNDNKNKLDLLIGNENVLYIKFIKFNEIENLIEYFVSAYKSGKFDDLRNNLSDLTSDIGNDILDIIEQRKDYINDIYFNVVYIEGLLKNLSDKDKSACFERNVQDQFTTLNYGIGKRFYSTKNETNL